jgi:hypothetical protein
MWAAVPTFEGTRREATMVRDFDEVPKDAERVVFLPAGGGRLSLFLAASIIVLAVLAIVGFGPSVAERVSPADPARRETRERIPAYDPGRERRAEARARALLRSVVVRPMSTRCTSSSASSPSMARRAMEVRLPALSAPPIVAFDVPTGASSSMSTASASRIAPSPRAHSGSRTRTTSSPSGCRCGLASVS